MKKCNFFSRDERHEAPFKFNSRFIFVKFSIEMCTHIGSTIMYLVCENNFFLKTNCSPFYKLVLVLCT